MFSSKIQKCIDDVWQKKLSALYISGSHMWKNVKTSHENLLITNTKEFNINLGLEKTVLSDRKQNISEFNISSVKQIWLVQTYECHSSELEMLI